ncbi:MAG: UMP kinase [Candidatus Thermoplasmatota archaeon]|nr:UMP kinase [Candidatus Thermoplasmatota archaeon]
MNRETEDLVISIGGSILLPEDEDIERLSSLAKILEKNRGKRNIYLVVGGGRIAREYINWGRELGADEATLDELGIETSRLNARLLILALEGDVYPVPAKNFNEAISAGNNHSIVTMGGTHPGHTTDAVAAMLAEKLGADRLINATSVDGVYTADPKKDGEAERLKQLTYEELIEIVSEGESGAGPNVVFDPLAARIIKRANIMTYIVDGRDLSTLKSAIQDEEFDGSKITR